MDLELDNALDGIFGEYQCGTCDVSALSGKLKERVSDTRYNEHRVRGGRVVVSREGRFSLGASGLDHAVGRREPRSRCPRV